MLLRWPLTLSSSTWKLGSVELWWIFGLDCFRISEAATSSSPGAGSSPFAGAAQAHVQGWSGFVRICQHRLTPAVIVWLFRSSVIIPGSLFSTSQLVCFTAYSAAPVSLGAVEASSHNTKRGSRSENVKNYFEPCAEMIQVLHICIHIIEESKDLGGFRPYGPSAAVVNFCCGLINKLTQLCVVFYLLFWWRYNGLGHLQELLKMTASLPKLAGSVRKCILQLKNFTFHSWGVGSHWYIGE